MNTTNKKALVVAIVFAFITFIMAIMYLSDCSYWWTCQYIAEGKRGGILQYVIAFILTGILSCFEYLKMKIADEHDNFLLELTVLPIIWPFEWLLFTALMTLPDFLF